MRLIVVVPNAYRDRFHRNCRWSVRWRGIAQTTSGMSAKSFLRRKAAREVSAATYFVSVVGDSVLIYLSGEAGRLFQFPLAKRKTKPKPKLKNNNGVYTPMPPSRQVPGVTSMPAVQSDWIRLAAYDPDGPADEIICWWGPPHFNTPATRETLRKHIQQWWSDVRRLSDYNDHHWLAILPWFEDRSEERQLYRVATDDDDDDDDAESGPIPASPGRKKSA